MYYSLIPNALSVIMAMRHMISSSSDHSDLVNPPNEQLDAYEYDIYMQINIYSNPIIIQSCY